MIPMAELDGKAIVNTLRDRTGRLVALSSGDV
jgi:hypothetical protein